MAEFFAKSNDGHIRTIDTVWNDARNNNTPDSITVTTSGALSCGAQDIGGNFYCYETFLAFDTSSIPDTDVVSSVTLEIDISVVPTWKFNQLEAWIVDWTSPLTTGQFVNGSDIIPSYTKVATRGLLSVSGTGLWSVTSTAAFPGQINLTGDTEIMLCTDNMSTGYQPGSGPTYSNVFSMVEGNGSSTGCKLTVAHAPATPGETGNFFMGSNF